MLGKLFFNKCCRRVETSLGNKLKYFQNLENELNLVCKASSGTEEAPAPAVSRDVLSTFYSMIDADNDVESSHSSHFDLAISVSYKLLVG